MISVVLLMGLALPGCSSNAELNKLEEQVSRLKAENSSLQTENSVLHAANTTLQAEKSILENEKTKLKVENSRLEAEKKALEIQKNEQVSELKAKLDKLETEFRVTMSEGPTYNEVMKFLEQDKTEEKDYELHETYTWEFIKNARAQGLRGYPVLVFTSTRILIFAGFTTTEGYIYILPLTGQQVRLTEGKGYLQINRNSPWGDQDFTIRRVVRLD